MFDLNKKNAARTGSGRIVMTTFFFATFDHKPLIFYKIIQGIVLSKIVVLKLKANHIERSAGLV